MKVARNGAARSQLSFGMFAGLAWLVSNHVVGCGDSSSNSPSTSTNPNLPGAQGSAGSGANGNGAGNGSGPSATPGSENTPNNIALDPNRDQSAPINLIASGAVQCGGAGIFCVAPSGTCCIAGGGGMMGGGNNFSCAASADGCPDGTTVTQECSSQTSCGGGQVCCRTGGGGGGMMGGGGGNTSCESACAMGSVQVCLEDAECGAGNQCNGNGTCGPVPCTSTSCDGGEICCRGQGGGAQNVCAAPDAAGACPNNQRKVCATAADCPADFTCSPAGGFGGGGGGGGGGNGVLVCTPPACTIDSCTAGQVCCVGGQVGGTPTCSAASDTGACPGNSRLLCETDAECAPTPGTFCLPAPNGGMGALSCRVPPPPPGDAGVGDAG